MKWHRMTGEDTLRQLGSRETGLTAKEASVRLKKYGRNTLYELPHANSDVARKLLTDPSLLLFVFVTLLTACFSELFSASAAFLVFVVWCGFIFRQLFLIRQERDRIRLRSVPTVTVIRSGKRLRVSAVKVTVGDILLLRRGDIVPADCRLLSSSELRIRFCYDSVSAEEKKTVFQQKNANKVYSYQSEPNAPDYENLLYGGSEIISGHAKAVVCAIGQACFCGASQKTLLQDPFSKTATVLTEPIRVFGLFGMISLLLLLPLGLIGMLISPTYQSGLRIFFPLCAWAASASAVLPFCYVRILAHNGIRTDKRKRNGGIVKSSVAIDRLSSLSDLVLIGSSPFLDGKLHFDSAFVGGSHFHATQSNEVDLQPLCEAFCLLEKATERLPEDLSYLSKQNEPYLDELVLFSGFDKDALELRIKRIELFRGKQEQILDVESNDGQFRLRFYSVHASLFGCGEIYDLNGKRVLLSREIRSAYATYLAQETEKGCSVVTVVKEQGGHTFLLGCISKREARLENAKQILDELRQMHVSVRLFLNENEKKNVAQVRSFFLDEEMIHASSAPILQSVFADHRVFVGYSEAEIAKAVRMWRQKGHVVGVVCNDVSSRVAMSSASISFVCESESESIPILHRDADVLVTRATAGDGGVATIMQTVTDSRKTVFRIRDFSKKLLMLRIMQATVLILSVVTGIGTPPSFAVLYGTILTDLWLLIQCKAMTVDAETVRMPLRKRSEDLLGKVYLKQYLKTAVLPFLAIMAMLAVLFHLSHISSACCYTLILISLLSFPSIRCITEKNRIKQAWIGLLFLWLPVTVAVLLSSFLPTVSTWTELGGWSMAGGIALIICIFIEIFSLYFLPKIGTR
ncbi:MAG: cation-transporting P-type ATPase [Clostridia bacterium]|nr:cation-transporting P-type ATPase [Clostridia bacterium]